MIICIRQKNLADISKYLWLIMMLMSYKSSKVLSFLCPYAFYVLKLVPAKLALPSNATHNSDTNG